MSRDCTSIQVLTNHHVDTAVYDSFAVDIAKDIVASNNKDYYFFQYDDDEYVLVFSDDASTENGFDFSAHNCTAIILYRTDTTFTENRSLLLDGTSTEVGATPNVQNITLSGTYADASVQSAWQMYFVLGDMHVYNSEYMVYSSVSGYMPKLKEGVDYYVYAGLFLALSVIVFRLLDRIFGRVCRIH